jgi:hypothetical protein
MAANDRLSLDAGQSARRGRVALIALPKLVIAWMVLGVGAGFALAESKGVA